MSRDAMVPPDVGANADAVQEGLLPRSVNISHPRNGNGQSAPEIRTKVPGPESRSWMLRHRQLAAPMGPRPAELKLPSGRLRLEPPKEIVFARGFGCNVWDPDDNRFVDLAAGFGSALIGHNHPYVKRAVELQSDRLYQAMGDLYPADAKIGLMQQLASLFPDPGGQVIFGLSGADAVSAALKTALLATGKPGVLAFEGAYHGLSYGPLAACGLRPSYRKPFASQLNPEVKFVPYPDTGQLDEVESALRSGNIGALLLEPVMGRGGVRPLSAATLQRLRQLATDSDCLLIADEIWTGLGRCGSWLCTSEADVVPDLVCLAKGLGGGLPLSACLGKASVMRAWSQAEEVVHTSTFAGAPLACAASLACLDVLRRQRLLDRSRELGGWFLEALRTELSALSVEVRGQGLMVGVDLDGSAPTGASTAANRGLAGRLMRQLLKSGYITSTGGGTRDVLVLTPPLTIERRLLEAFIPVLKTAIQRL